MWLVVLWTILVSFTASAAVSVNAKIYDIDYGQGDQGSFLLLSSGHVAWLKKSSNKSRTDVFERAKRNREVMNFTLNDSNQLVSAKPVPQMSSPKRRLEPQFSVLEEFYEPTIVESLEAAKTYFEESRAVGRTSQCFNRAHVWSFEWFKNHGVLSNKSWVFFTRRYIREYEYNWWFHVAPSIAVQEGDVVREKVMDKEFSSRPLNTKEWTDIFMRDKANCPRVQKYSDYANYPESESCFLVRSSMFFHQPFDLETYDTHGIFKANWVDEDLKQAYLETFDEEF